MTSVAGMTVLDAGCGEGKNAVYLASLGAHVDAVDTSIAAITNGQREWSDVQAVKWLQSDIETFGVEEARYDLVVAYGLLHCLPTESVLRRTVRRLRQMTRAGGWHVVCAFNSRRQDLFAHPGLKPTLLGHSDYLALYSSDEVVYQSDTNLTETHPHNRIEHTHALTRLIVRKASNAG